jgi:hypothetical protein
MLLYAQMWMNRLAPPNSTPPAVTTGESFVRSPMLPSHRFLTAGTEPAVRL